MVVQGSETGRIHPKCRLDEGLERKGWNVQSRSQKGWNGKVDDRNDAVKDINDIHGCNFWCALMMHSICIHIHKSNVILKCILIYSAEILLNSFYSFRGTSILKIKTDILIHHSWCAIRVCHPRGDVSRSSSWLESSSPSWPAPRAPRHHGWPGDLGKHWLRWWQFSERFEASVCCGMGLNEGFYFNFFGL